MDIKPFSTLISGEWKTGKTHSLLTVFRSAYVVPERVLYIDNHGSTRGFPHIHRYTDKEPWGIWETDYTMTEEVDKKIVSIMNAARRGQPPYDVICLDDTTELEFTTFDAEEDKFSGRDKRQLWGEHLDKMCERQRRLIHKSGASFLATCRVAAMDDFTKPGVRDRDTGQLVRPQIIRPLIRGKSGEWISYEYDALIWTRMDRARDGKSVGIYDFKPEGAIRCGHRWEYYPDWPTEIKEPTFDKLVDLITAAEKWAVDNLGGN